MSRSFIPEIVDQHAEEAAFLWILRDLATRAPNYDLADLVRLDERVEAHLDGLRILEEIGWNRCRAGLEHKEAGEIFAAGVIAMESRQKDWLDDLLEAVESTPEAEGGLGGALQWVSPECAVPQLSSLLASGSAVLQSAGIVGAAAHDHDIGPKLDDFLFAEADGLRRSAYEAVGRMACHDLLPSLVPGLQDPNPACRFWAAWSTVLLGEAAGVKTLERIVEEDDAFREPATALLMQRLEPSAALQWHRTLAQDPRFARASVVAAGALGDPSLVPWLVERMAEPKVAKVAGEAFSLITGVRIGESGLSRTPPPEVEPGPTEDPADGNVGLDPDEHLPWPDPALIARWWKEHEPAFAPGARYLVGQPIQREWLCEVLRSGRQRHRAVAALELVLAQPGQRPFDVTAPGYRQQRLLGIG